MSAPAIIVDGVVKSFGSRSSDRTTMVLNSLSLSVGEGKIVSLYGPNGCGKTTLLNLLAGLDKPDHGKISYRDGARPIVGYAFQDYHKSLLPWRTALENVEFPFLARGEAQRAARSRATEFLCREAFTFTHNAYPYQMSAGQQQAVALAAVLAPAPSVLLLDEPFSAFDHRARIFMQRSLQELVQGQTCAVVVSHDIDEALLVCDELVLLSSRPARVVEVFEIPFPRPRSPDLLLEESFGRVRREVLARFIKEGES